jgi:hypothetical protein
MHMTGDVQMDEMAWVNDERFEGALQEIFAVQVLHNRYPDLIDEDVTILGNSFVLPDESLAEVAAPFRH